MNIQLIGWLLYEETANASMARKNTRIINSFIIKLFKEGAIFLAKTLKTRHLLLHPKCARSQIGVQHRHLDV